MAHRRQPDLRHQLPVSPSTATRRGRCSCRPPSSSSGSTLAAVSHAARRPPFAHRAGGRHGATGPAPDHPNCGRRRCVGRPGAGGHAQPAARVPVDSYGSLRWRFIGPEGNRFAAVAGVPGDPNIYYAGAASGGICKTTDGGVHWAADLRRSAGPVDRLARRRAVRSEHRLGRHRRGVHPQPHLDRRGDLQVDRRRQDVDADGPREDRPHRAASSSIRPIPNIVLACALGHAYGPQPERGVFRTTDGGETGRRCCSSTRTPAAPTWRWTRRTRACCSPACGSSRSTRGAARAAARAAGSSCRATAARHGRGSPATACRPSRSARSTLAIARVESRTASTR